MQFRAISYGLFGKEDYHKAVRRKAVKYMNEHRQDFEAFLGESFRSYMKEMAHNSSWGDELTLARATCICMLHLHATFACYICMLHLHAAPAYCVTIHTDCSGWKLWCVSLLCKLYGACSCDSWLPDQNLTYCLLLQEERDSDMGSTLWSCLHDRQHSSILVQTLAQDWQTYCSHEALHLLVMRFKWSNVFCRGLCARRMALSSTSSPVTSRTGSCDTRLRCSRRTTWKYLSHTLRPYTTTLSGMCSTMTTSNQLCDAVSCKV